MVHNTQQQELAFKRELLSQTSYDDNAEIAEKNIFKKLFSALVQLIQ